MHPENFNLVFSNKTRIFNFLKTQILYISLICNCYNSIAQENLNQTDSLGRKIGAWTINLENDTVNGYYQISVNCFYENGILNGYYYVFNKEELIQEATYLNGKKQGVEKIFKFNRIQKLNVYQQGNLIYSSKYNPKGVIFEEINFNEQGKKEGFSRLYHKNGKIWIESYYKNDVLNGYQTIYKKNGKLYNLILYKDGISN